MIRKHIIVISLVAIVLLAVLFYNLAIPRISVSGTGTVSATPDQGQISFTVREMDTLAANAVSRQAAIMEKVLVALVADGIAKEDITTSGYSLNPVYNYTDSRDYIPPPASEEIIGECPPPAGEEKIGEWPPLVSEEIIGYEVVQSVQVIVNDLPKIGGILDKIVQAGVKQIDYISFSFKDSTYDSLRAQAYKIAVDDARGQADAIVGATGGFIIGIASLSTNYWGPLYAEKIDMPSGIMTPQTPIVPSGSITVTANINIMYLYL
ncbi:SIMPL domain-containing protein [[Eubacterium] cellulosolvens]